jgi:hypothetical protein
MDERGVAAADGAETGSHESQAAEGNAGKVLELIKSATGTAAAPAGTDTSEGDGSEPEASGGSASTPIPQQSQSGSE